MTGWPAHLRRAGRYLTRHRAFALAAVVTLAIGIAVNGVVFTLVRGALFRPPPFPEPEQLVVVYRTVTSATRPTRLQRWSFSRAAVIEREARAFEGVARFIRVDLNLSGGNEPARVAAEVVSAGYFPLLKATPVLGRTFLPGSAVVAGANPVAVLGHSLWHRRFGADSTVLGRPIRVNGEPLTVVGVAPPGFGGLTERAELWVPETMAPRLTYAGHLTTNQDFISVIGRLRDGAALQQAQAELAVLGARAEELAPSEVDVPTQFGATAVPLGQARIDPSNRRSMLLLLAAVGFLLLLASANLAGLGVANATRRRHDVAVRLALGATRGQLIRQLLTESLLVGAVGSALGMALTVGAAGLVAPPRAGAGPGNMYGVLGEFSVARVDAQVLGFVVAVSLLAITLSGLVPALFASRTDPGAELKDHGGSRSTASRRGHRIQSGLVVVEVALALTLSIGGSLLLASLRQFQSHPLGFQPGNLLTFRIEPSGTRYGAADAPALLDGIIQQISLVPGVRSVTVDGCTPGGARCARSELGIAGRPEPPPGQAALVTRHYVAPDHFGTLGIPLLRGRGLNRSDGAGRPGVAVINQTAADRFWAGTDPIGQRVWFPGGSAFHDPETSVEIVGVVGDVPYGTFEQGPVPSFYTSYRQFTYASRVVMIRTDDDPLALVPSVRGAVRAIGDLPIFDVRTMEDRLGDSWARTRFNTSLVGGFAVLALLLAAAGVYGVVAHSVSQRTRELGVRMALGASAADVGRLVVREGLTLAGLGVFIGLASSLALSRVMGGFLFEVSALDPGILGAQAVLLLATAAAACWAPARRAARIDPVASLNAG